MCFERHGTQANDTRIPAFDLFDCCSEPGEESLLLSPGGDELLLEMESTIFFNFGNSLSRN